MIRETFKHIGDHYLTAKNEPYSGNFLASYIRNFGKSSVEDVLGDFKDYLYVKASSGQTRWASVPWVGIFDPIVTRTPQKGYYVVYLFSETMDKVFLSLNQGTASVRKEFNNNDVIRQTLQSRASLIRSKTPEAVDKFPLKVISLNSEQYRPLDYEAGHAFGKSYLLNELPSEEDLIRDLHNIIKFYLELTYKGGISLVGESFEDEFNISEQRRYILHKKIERNPHIALRVKKVHGYVCQACKFDFTAFYGELGKEYIEAHHLQPLAELPENKPVSMNLKEDFAVLCANCHRMLHRTNAPKRFSEFLKILKT
ncbi:MAG: DUF3578 domain-containing protein [Vampirovibrio sp.]|nr:DUF3578 domain-containing protein [Vampirovibrio sp.]